MHNLKHFLFLSFICLGLTCLGQSATIRGYVIDKSTGGPMIFTKVKVTSISGTISGAMTDADGFFSVPKLDTGNFEIRIECIDFKPLITNVHIKSPTEIIDLKFALEAEENNEFPGDNWPKPKAETPRTTLTKEEIERIPSVNEPEKGSKFRRKRRRN